MGIIEEIAEYLSKFREILRAVKRNWRIHDSIYF